MCSDAKGNVGDLEFIEELEREIGYRIPRRNVNGRIPNRSPRFFIRREKGGRTFEDTEYDSQKDDVPFHELGTRSSFGCFVDANGNIVGLSLAGAELGFEPSALRKLRNLKRLDLVQNGLRAFPEGIRGFPNLELMNVGGNEIRTIPPWALEFGLDFSRDLGERGIFVSGNPLQSPPMEIVKQGMDAIRSYFWSLEGDKLPLNEAKILLVGDGGAGKTSLVKRLLRQKFDENEGQTHGINIDSWSVKAEERSIKVHLWDFGGQEIMHATHQFFLSERSLYVLVLDGRKEEDAEYWLKHIESFGGDSPILVVLNKIDENPGFDVNRRFLKKKYKGIVEFYRVSCKKNAGIQAFRNGIIGALGHVDIIQTLWPASWFEIKSRLEDMEKPFISYDDYQQLCEKSAVAETSTQNTLVRFLHDLGVIVHFDDFRLRDTHVLQPRWLTGAVYRIINSDSLAKAKGVLKLRTLPRILKRKDGSFEYPADKHPYIIDLMKKFELCFSIDDKTVLIPDLLDVQEPEIDFDYEASLRFRLDYDFLPKSVMARFIVKKHRDIKDELRWRTGVVLEDESFESSAVIKADEAAKRIYIYVGGEHRRDYFMVIRSAFREINRSFEKLRVTEKVPLPDDPEVTVSYDHLMRLEKDGVEEYFPDGAEHSYKVKDLLGTVYVEKQRTEAEFLAILRKVIDPSDSEETALEKANDIITVNPNFFGFGINLNNLVKKLLGKKKK